MHINVTLGFETSSHSQLHVVVFMYDMYVQCSELVVHVASK